MIALEFESSIINLIRSSGSASSIGTGTPPMDNIDSYECVRLIKYGDETALSVYVYDGKYEWDWAFDISNPSDYERIKLCVFDVICECDTMEELACMMDALFREAFDDILIVDVDECESCCECEYCGYSQ